MKYTKPLAAACIAIALLFTAGCALTADSYAQKQYDIDMARSYVSTIGFIADQISGSRSGGPVPTPQNSFDSDGKLTASQAVPKEQIKESIKSFNEQAAEMAGLYGSKVKAKSIGGTPADIAADAYKGKTEKEIKDDLKAKYPLQ